MNKRIFCLIKFGTEKHLTELLTEGKLHFSSIQELRKNNKDDSEELFRNDSIEGVREYRSLGPTKIKLGPFTENGEPLEVAVENITYWRSREFTMGNICSFYGITEDCFSDNIFVPIDERLKLFGSHYIVIYNIDEFHKRLYRAMQKNPIASYYYGLVEYFDERNSTTDLNLFHKRSRYSYQKEYRVYLETDNITAMDIYLGNLKDIAFVYPVETIEYLKLNFDHNSGAVRMTLKF